MTKLSPNLRPLLRTPSSHACGRRRVRLRLAAIGFSSICISRVCLSLLCLVVAGCEDTLPVDGPATTKVSDRKESAVADDDPRELVPLIDEVLDFTRDRRQLDSTRHAAWQILHGVLAYGRDFEITHEGKPVNTIDWVFTGGQLRGWTMRPGEVGLKAVLEAGSKAGQGHEDQWLAVLSQCDLPPDQKIVVGDDEFTMLDLVRQTQHDVFVGKECSWTLIGLTHYLPIDAEWKASDGSTWTIERIVGMEAGEHLETEEDITRHINEAACGGTHRLIGMTMALDRYLRQKPDVSRDQLEGGWAEAEERIEWAIDMARRNQLPSGAFSVNYFNRPTDSPDLSEHLGSTGHTLEFLALALDDQRIQQPWVTRAARSMCRVFKMTENIDLECGKLYHAAHGLVLYRERVMALERNQSPDAQSP